MKAWVIVGAAAFAALGGIATLYSQQIERFEQFDNDVVHVWKSVIPPGAPRTMHRHDHPRIAIVLRGGTLQLVDAKGKIETHVWESGKAYWMPSMEPGAMHADVNASSKPIEVVMVELKKEKSR